MDRSRMTLDGSWQFWTDPKSKLCPSSLDTAGSMDIHVPAPWQSQSDELRNYSGPAWYRRTVSLTGGWLDGDSVFLGIGAADYYSQVWVNGSCAGEHEGGYLPFELDITHLIHSGENEIAIRISDPPEEFAEIPHGKQGWYGALSGIWQSAWLEKRSTQHIRSVEAFPQPASGCVRVTAVIAGKTNPCHHITAKLFSPVGGLADSVDIPTSADGNVVSLDLQASDPALWSPEQPNMYRVELQLQCGAEILDCQTKTFGYRTIEARDGKIYLNGKVLYLRAALDQDYYPDTIYTTPSAAFLEDEFTKAKELGLNCLRCHIKPADPRYYDLADRMGLLVWTEIPNWAALNARSKALGRRTFEEMLARDGHHPSIIIWTVINEDWGTDLVNEESHRRWLREMYQWVKQADPSRLVVDNSPCLPNFHVESDIDDFHFYRGVPDRRHEWDAFVSGFSKRAPYTYSQNGDAVRTGKEPLIVSEFGNWGLPDADLLVDEDGRDPWWFETGYSWQEGVVYPKGVKGRYHKLNLDRVFGSWKGMIEATQQQEFTALKYQIEAMRLKKEIQGYVITELTDVHWECNGLLDMKRSPKSFHNDLKMVNANTIIVPEWEQVAYAPGDTVRVGIHVAHGSGSPLQGASLSWSLEGGPRSASGAAAVPVVKPGCVERSGLAVFAVPVVTQATVRRLNMELRDAAGELINRSFLDLTFYQPRTGVPPAAAQAAIYTDDKRLAHTLESFGYIVTEELAKAALAVAAKADPAMLDFVQQGGRMLVLADRNREKGKVFPGIQIETRKGSPWEGDWASTFSWIERDGSLARIPGGPLVDHNFDCIIPDYVLTGFKEWDYASSVHAGIFVGWVHKPAALIAEKKYGKGKVVFNTFNLPDDTVGIDATAAQLFDALIEMSLS